MAGRGKVGSMNWIGSDLGVFFVSLLSFWKAPPMKVSIFLPRVYVREILDGSWAAGGEGFG